MRLQYAADERPGAKGGCLDVEMRPSRRRFCARTCAPSILRPGGLAETLPALVRDALGVCRGHYGRRGLCETGETGVVVLITQRSQVQILPPLPIKQVRGPSQS
jgi:hypothetical protein